ncbi:hypothetical protein FRX31_015739, partial [Thalictrum thalictroides]
MLLYFGIPCCDNLEEPPESRPDYTDWYCINPKHSPQPGERLSRLSRMLSVDHQSPECLSCTVLGSDIHCFGGTSPECGDNLPSLLSTYSTVTNEWSCNIPLPVAMRVYPFLLTCGGLLFAIGCLVLPPSSVCPWAECYSPFENQWISLPDLPVEFNPVLDFDTTSIVLDDTRMYAYNFQRSGDSLEQVYNLDRIPSFIRRPHSEVFPFHLGGKDFFFVWSRILNPHPAVNTSL